MHRGRSQPSLPFAHKDARDAESCTGQVVYFSFVLGFTTAIWRAPGEGRSDDQRECYRGLGVDLDAVAVQLDLPPADSLVRPRACIAAIELLRRVDVHGTLGAVAHQVGVGNVVLDDAAAQDDHAGPLRPHRDGVDLADVLHDVYAQLLGRRLERVEVQHVAQAAVGQGRAEDGNVVLPGPVVDRVLVVDLLAQAVDHLAWRPVHRLVRLLALLLLGQHGVEDGQHPVLEGAVVVVGHDEVADAVQALCTQAGAGRGELAQVGRAQTLDEVLLDAAGRGDDGGDMLVLYQVAQRLAQARGDQVGRVAQEQGGAVACFGIPPRALSVLESVWAKHAPFRLNCFARAQQPGSARSPGMPRTGESMRHRETTALTMSFTIRTASPMAVAWNPMREYPPTSSSTVMGRCAYALKSMPRTSRASAGTGSEGLRTASVAPVGAASGAACCVGGVMFWGGGGVQRQWVERRGVQTTGEEERQSTTNKIKNKNQSKRRSRCRS